MTGRRTISFECIHKGVTRRYRRMCTFKAPEVTHEGGVKACLVWSGFKEGIEMYFQARDNHLRYMTKSPSFYPAPLSTRTTPRKRYQIPSPLKPYCCGLLHLLAQQSPPYLTSSQEHNDNYLGP